MSIPVLPDFTRYQWGSVVEKQWFQPLAQEASNAFVEVERLSVAEGVRKAAWQFVSYNELVSLSNWAREHDLVVIPVHDTHVGSSYSSTGGGGGTNNAYRVVITRPENYKEVIPFEGDDHIGKMLGFPECCRKAFAETWAKGAVDTTWEQVQKPAGLASTLLRWMGLRLVPHLPCTFTCQQSIWLAGKMFDVGVKHGFLEEMMFIQEALNWPMSATRLFGIAELITPPLKIVTRSTWTPTKEDFFVPGHYVKPTKDLWTDNGFSDPAAMRQSHNPLVQAIKEHAPHGARVLDLGCGNGLLLKRVKRHRTDIRIHGIDINKAAISRATGVMSDLRFVAGRIQDLPWEKVCAGLVLINPARLSEMDPADAQSTREKLAKHKTLVYCYSDFDNLEKLCAVVNLPAPQMLAKTPYVQVGVIQ